MKEDLIQQLTALRRELTALQARLTDTLELAARLPDDRPRDDVTCPLCGLRRPTVLAMAAHLSNVHGRDPRHAASPAAATHHRQGPAPPP